MIKVKKLYLPTFIIVLAIYLDQLTKWLAVTYLKNVVSLPIIKDVLHLTYLENTGAAFGSFKDHRWVFLIASSVALIAFLFFLFFKTPKHILGRISLALLLGGGVGNMIDRIMLGYVVDFVDFRLINFAIFNFADACVTVGTVLLFIYVIWFMEKTETEEKPLE